MQLAWPPMVSFMIGLMIIFLVVILIAVSVVKRCYLLVPAEQAIVVTGMGPTKVSTSGGLLVFPVVNLVRFVPLTWQSIQVDFPSSEPLLFSDQSTLNAPVTVWISIDATESNILSAVKNLGDRCGEPDLIASLYVDSIRQAIRKVAAKSDRQGWMDALPEIPADLQQAIKSCVEDFHVVQRVTIAA